MARLTADEVQALHEELARVHDSLRKRASKRTGYTSKQSETGNFFLTLKKQFLEDLDPYCDYETLDLPPTKAQQRKHFLQIHLASYYEDKSPLICVRGIEGHVPGKGYALKVFYKDEPVCRTFQGFETKRDKEGPSKAELNALLHHLTSHDIEIVIRTIQRLGELEAPAAVPKLLAILESNITAFAPDLARDIQKGLRDLTIRGPVDGLDPPEDAQQKAAVRDSLKRLLASDIQEVAASGKRLLEIEIKPYIAVALDALTQYPARDLIRLLTWALGRITSPDARNGLLRALERSAEAFPERREREHDLAQSYLVEAIYRQSSKRTIHDLAKYADDPRLSPGVRSLIQAAEKHCMNHSGEDLVRIILSGPTNYHASDIPSLVATLSSGYWPRNLQAADTLRSRLISGLCPRRSTTERLEHIFRESEAPEVKALALYAASAGQPSKPFLEAVVRSLRGVEIETLPPPQLPSPERGLLLSKTWFLGQHWREYETPTPLLNLLKKFRQDEPRFQVLLITLAHALGRTGSTDAIVPLRECKGPMSFPSTLSLLLARFLLEEEGAEYYFRRLLSKPDARESKKFLAYARKRSIDGRIDRADLWEGIFDEMTIHCIKREMAPEGTPVERGGIFPDRSHDGPPLTYVNPLLRHQLEESIRQCLAELEA